MMRARLMHLMVLMGASTYRADGHSRNVSWQPDPTVSTGTGAEVRSPFPSYATDAEVNWSW